MPGRTEGPASPSRRILPGSGRFEIRGGNLGSLHLDLFEAEGVDPARVIIGHTDENADIRQLISLARRGAYVQFDVIGKLHWLLDETRVELLVKLADAGHIDRLLLGTDRNRVSELKVAAAPATITCCGNSFPSCGKPGLMTLC